MRSYEEFAEEVFREADRRLALKKKRSAIMRRYTFALASMFAIVLTGVFFLRNETAKEALEKKYNDDDIITVEPEPTTTLPVITTAPSGTEVIITTISADITDNGETSETTAQTTAEDEIPQPETTTATAETSGDTENNVSTTALSVHTSGQPPDKQTTTAQTTFARTTTSATTEGLTEGIPTTTTVRKPSAEATTVKTTTTTTRKYSPIVTTTTTRRTVTTTTTAATEPEPTPEPTTTRRTTTTTTTSTTTRRTVTTTTTTTSTTTRRTVTTTTTGSPGDAQTPPATSTTTAAPIIATTSIVPPPEVDGPDAPIATTAIPESDKTTTTAPAPSAPSGYSDIQLPADVVGSSGNGADSVTYIFACELPYDFEPGEYLCESMLMIDGVSYVCDAYICPGMPAEECVAVYIWDTGQWAYYAV